MIRNKNLKKTAMSNPIIVSTNADFCNIFVIKATKNTVSLQLLANYRQMVMDCIYLDSKTKKEEGI